jgi:hypothetical protein
MDCRKVQELADSYLSGQLLVETTHEIVRHVETCPDCREDLAARRTLRDRLQAAIANAPSLRSRPEFAEELRAALRPQAAVVSRRDALRTWGSLAAGLAIAAAGGAFTWRWRRSSSELAALARQAAGDHLNCAVEFRLREQPISLEEAGRRYGAPYGALIAFTMPEVDGPVRIIDRHACVYDGQRFAHLVFESGGQLMSLLVTPGDAPAAPTLASVEGRVGVAVLPAGRYIGFVVASAGQAQLLGVAQALVAPLAQQLA